MSDQPVADVRQDDVNKDVINEVKVTQEVDEYGFLDDLVKDKLERNPEQDEQLAINKMLDLALLDGNNNNRDIEEMTVDQFGFDDNVLNEDFSQGGFLDFFNTHQDIFPTTSLSELNQTLDTDN
eukprot:TRINITY_DN17576_c0_g1_i1.p1 TRINITY_DN17576_c0_g1~~TRINITY_DN17576_c0_g1_i1.p1  ORF type:complete len:124 (-),score=50.09 TRINITY_DN17576_c0_g1_i1:67-438(-)